MALHGLRPDDPVSLGPYELRGRLGAGGMGVVYLGFGPDGQAVAVKTLPSTAAKDSRERMRREARVLGSLDFPRVASLVAADTDADTPWLALAYISGPSLLEAAKPLRDAPLRQLAEGLAEALSALHDSGITHRDVKPANVILTFDGPVLVDLGIARTEDMTSLTQVGTVIGSAGWMAPEQLRGTAETAATDVWGWGAVLVYAATGRSPFGEGHLDALAWRIQSTEPELAGIPGWLLPAVKGALAKNPAARPPARLLFPGPHSHAHPVRAPAREGTALPAAGPHAEGPAVQAQVRTAGTGTGPEAAPRPQPAAPTPYPSPAMPGRPSEHGSPQAPSPPHRPSSSPAPGRNPRKIVTVAILAVIGVLALVTVLIAIGAGRKLPAPANVEAVTTPRGVNLSWDAVNSADHYAVYRDNRVISGNVRGTSYTDRGGTAAPHSYNVYAINSLGMKGEKGQSVSTVPQPSDSPVPAPTTPSSASTPLSSADQALVNVLPIGVVDPSSCVHYSQFASPSIIGAVSCSTSGTTTDGAPPQAIYAYQDRTPAAFKQHFTQVNKSFNPANADCDKPPARGVWRFISQPKVIVGSHLCYIDKTAKKPTIQWTYDAAAIAIIAVGADQDAAGLNKWWVHAKLHLR
jgi:serine/threonine protein kinase